METATHGYFVISLDFELFWGIRDIYSFEHYGENVLGVWDVIPKLLDSFSAYGIHATFATVGAMFAKDKDELMHYIPTVKPEYSDQNLSPYNGYIEQSDRNDYRYYYGDKLVQMVKKYPNHEIASHTFTHYYCLEPGQTESSFTEDLSSALAIAESKGIKISSFVFPRHQLNHLYIEQFKNLGINCYRGTERAWFHSPQRGADEGIIKRAFRYADYFIWMGSNHLQQLDEIKQRDIYCIQASRWMRPYDHRTIFQRLKMIRIKRQMSAAAKQNKIFHLWWHPHEFGVDTDENMNMLKEVLDHYHKLNLKYGFKSMNMRELVNHYEGK